MDTKHIHCMLEKMSEYGKCMIEEGAGNGNVNLDDAGKIVDMVKDLACAEKDALIAKEMRKAHEEEESEEKHFLKMLKEEKEEEYKRMKEEYGDEEGERRFYDNYRYKRSGRFAPKGRGSYMPRRGYEKPPYYHMMPNEAEWNRDMDRMDGKMYYSGGQSSGGNSGGQGGQSSGGSSSGNMSKNMGGSSSGGSTRGYEEGYSDGNRRGYEEGYREGSRGSQRDSREGRSGRNRRTYMETKEMNKGNSPEEKQKKMKELENYTKELAEDVTEMISDATPEEKALLKQKMQVLMQKI